MKPVLFALLALFLLTASPVFAESQFGEDGLEVLEIKAYEPSLFERLFGSPALAILLDKGTYEPGGVAKVTIGSLIECNTKYAYLVIESGDGSKMYSVDVSDLVKPCSTSYVSVTVRAPNTPGTYTIAVDFKDGIGKQIYRDSTVFVVAAPNTPVTCPKASCTDWTRAQTIENGYWEVKTCYAYKATTCEQYPPIQSYRTVCNSGFVIEGGERGKCVSPQSTGSNPVAVCGDAVKQSGEECDYGFENGACPATCNNMCRLSTCEQLPRIDPEEETPSAPESSGVSWGLVATGVAGLLLLGFGIVKLRKK